jgi:hypothetical protein
MIIVFAGKEATITRVCNYREKPGMKYILNNSTVHRNRYLTKESESRGGA